MSFDNDTRCDDVISSSGYFLCVLVMLITLLAVVTNTVALVITFSVRTIRTATYSVFFVNLCLAALLASSTTMYLSIMTVLGQSLDKYPGWLQVLGGIQECTMTVTVLTIAITSLEKYMYIKYPLYHEICITLQKSIASLFVAWGIGIFIAAWPKFGFGNYFLHTSGVVLSIKWTYPLIDKVTAVTNLCFLFVLPFIEFVIISLDLYQVVKRAMVSIEPVPSPLRPNISRTSLKPRDYNTMFVVDMSDPQLKTTTAETHVRTTELGINSQRFNSVSNGSTVEAGSFKHVQRLAVNNANSTGPTNTIGTKVNSNHTHTLNRKALMVLALPLCYFTIVWLPIKLVQVVKTFDKMTSPDADRYHTMDTVAFLLVMTSHALNPLVHALMCKSFRQEFAEACKTRCCVDKDAVRPYSFDGSNEDFLQFLFRTSESSQGDRIMNNNGECEHAV